MTKFELIEDLVYSDAYSQYIMDHADNQELIRCRLSPITNGNSLVEAMEAEYLFVEFLKSIGLQR